MNNGGQVCPKPTLGFSRPNFAGFEFTNKTSWRYKEWSGKTNHRCENWLSEPCSAVESGGFGAKIDLLHLMGSSSAFHNWIRYDKPTYIAHFGVTYVSSWSPAGDGGSSTLLIIVTDQRHIIIRNYARFFQLATFLNGASQRGKGFSQPKQRVATAPLAYTKKSVTWCNTVGTVVSTVNCQKERERRRFIERRTSPGAGIRARLDSRLLGYSPQTAPDESGRSSRRLTKTVLIWSRDVSQFATLQRKIKSNTTNNVRYNWHEICKAELMRSKWNQNLKNRNCFQQ